VCRGASRTLAAHDLVSVPAPSVTQALSERLGHPLLADHVDRTGKTEPMNEPNAIRDRFQKLVQASSTAGAFRSADHGVDLTATRPVLIVAAASTPRCRPQSRKSA